MILTSARARLCAFCLVAVVSILSVPQASSQEYGRIEDTQATTPGYFFYARPGEPVVAVTAVGAFAATGRYLLGEGADVADLLALSGGVQAAPTGEDPTVRVYRDGQTVYQSGLRSVYGPSAAPPVLEDEDVVEITSLLTTAPGFHVHSLPGEETVVVTAAGAFAAPGRYVIGDGATVGDLVALAGGLAGFARDTDVEVTTTVRVYRGGGVAFESGLTDLYARTTPVLEAGDVIDLEVVTERRSSFTLRDALSLTTAVLSAAVLIERLVNN